MREIVMRCQYCGFNFTVYENRAREQPWSEDQIRSIIREEFRRGQARCTNCDHSQPLSNNLRQVGRLSTHKNNIGFPSNEDLHRRNVLNEINELRSALGPICSEGLLHLLKLVWERYGADHQDDSFARMVDIYHLYGGENNNSAFQIGSQSLEYMIAQMTMQFTASFRCISQAGAAFCVFVPRVAPVAQVTHRVYVNVNPSNCFSAITGVFNLLQNRGTLSSFKFCSSMADMSVRSDNMVIYLTGNTEQSQIVSGFSRLSPRCFREGRPRMTLQMARGVSIGAEPQMLGVDLSASTRDRIVLAAVRQQSFGKFRSEVIHCALIHCGGDRVEFHRLIRLFFGQAGLDPMKPHEQKEAERG